MTENGQMWNRIMIRFDPFWPKIAKNGQMHGKVNGTQCKYSRIVMYHMFYVKSYLAKFE